MLCAVGAVYGSGDDYNGYDDDVDDWDDDNGHYDDRINGDGAAQHRGLCILLALAHDT